MDIIDGMEEPTAGAGAERQKFSEANHLKRKANDHEPECTKLPVKKKMLRKRKSKVAIKPSEESQPSDLCLNSDVTAALVPFNVSASFGHLAFIESINIGLQSHGLKLDIDYHNISNTGNSTNFVAPLNDMRIWVPISGFNTAIPLLTTYSVAHANQLSGSGKWVEMPMIIFSPSATIPQDLFAGKLPEVGTPGKVNWCQCWDVFASCCHRGDDKKVEEVNELSEGGVVSSVVKTIPNPETWSTFAAELKSIGDIVKFFEDGTELFVPPLEWVAKKPSDAQMKNLTNLAKDYCYACCTLASDAESSLTTLLPIATKRRATADAIKKGNSRLVTKTHCEIAEEYKSNRRQLAS